VEQDRKAKLSRRRLLALAGAGGAGLVATRVARSDPSPSPPPPVPTSITVPEGPAGPSPAIPLGARRWSDPLTWTGPVPGPGDTASVRGEVYLDTDAEVAGVIIGPDDALVFDPGASRSLRSTGNVVVEGRLALRPDSPAVIHRLGFAGIDESRFEGGGNDVLDSDVGLWVMGEGVLDVAGSPKSAWTHTAGTVPAGAATITLAPAPSGWQVGDEIVLTPTGRPGEQGVEHWSSYDLATVTGIDGAEVSLDRPAAFAHPEVVTADGTARRAEVLNLSRNVVIEGEEAGRSHIFLRSSVPQSVQYLAIRHLGPRQKAGGATEFVGGRYGIHLHTVEDASRGSIFEGVVGRQIGSHTFVTHRSHGVTWRDCITHDTLEDAYWWDPRDPATGKEDPTDDVLYERCVASMVAADGAGNFRLAGYFLGAGSGNTARHCIAVGVKGRSDACGYLWPNESEGVWTFEDCLAHNNKVNGIFVWQNTERLHVVTRFTGVHNGSFGISHGAYKNSYVYEDAILHANGEGALRLKAVSRTVTGPLQFIRCDGDAGGLSPYAVQVDGHTQPPDLPTEFAGCAWRGATDAAFGFAGAGSNPHLLDIIDNRFEGNEFWLADGVPPGTRIRVDDEEHGAIALEGMNGSGEVNPAWNARVTPIDPLGD